MIKVAVITRTKNRPDFLRRAIRSVDNQTYRNFVHVIVNDGGEKEVIEQIVGHTATTEPERIKIFHRIEASSGPDTIFNESIEYVQSTYVVIHDDDDTWHPEFLERTVKLLEEGAAGVVVRTNKIIETTDGKALNTTHYMPDLSAVSLYRQCIDNQLTPIAFIYRRDAYEKVGKYDTSLPVVGDWEFGIRFLRQYDVEYLDPGFALANYHHRKQHTDNSFAKHNHKRYVTKVANKYLRDDLRTNTLGLGYIISDLKFRMDVRHKIIKKIVPSFITKRIKY